MAKNQLVVTINSKDLYQKIKNLPRGVKGLIIEIALIEFLNNPKNQRILSLIEQNEISISDVLKEFIINKEENTEKKEKQKEKKEEEKRKEEKHIENKTKEEKEETIEEKDEDETDGIDPADFFEF